MHRAKRPDRRHLLASGRHPTRRDGAIAIALFTLPWVAALFLVRHYHHLDGGTVAILVSVSLGLPSLWLMWTTYRGPKRVGTSASGLSIAQIADQLAIGVRSQWNAEAAMRRLNDPYPLPVSWEAADASLTDPWDSLVRLATSGAGSPPPPPEGTWAAGPEDLAGEGGKLADVLAQVPTGRLIVLGEWGAGKTMLMVRLVLDLLARRVSGGPVPVLASLASWNPADADQDLHGWLAAQLALEHPFLATAAPPGAGEVTCIQALLGARPSLILPILDGLDEIPDAVRGPAIARINEALKPGEQVVVTCRTEQYKDAIWPRGGVRTTVTVAAAVQLCPLDADAVSGYLCATGGPGAAERWHPVLRALGTREPVGQVLSMPLMTGLARTIYNPRAGEATGELRDPAELCQLADKAAVEAQLFDAFVPASYRSGRPCPWTAKQAETWLQFLARHLERMIGNPDLAWWQLRRAVPRTAWVLGAGLGAGLTFGLVAGFGTGFGTGRKAGLPSAPHGLVGRLLGGFGDALAYALFVARGRGAGLIFGLVVGLVAALGIGFAAWLGTGLPAELEGVPGDLAREASPRAVLARDQQLALFRLLGAVLVFGLVSGLLGGLRAGLVGGLGTGLLVGLGLSLASTAWPSYMLTRGWLALRHRLPWSLMSFLADAHQRGVLRQVGAVYQFRHIELQHRLANRNTDKGGYDGLRWPHLDGLNRPHHDLPDASVALIWPRF